MRIALLILLVLGTAAAQTLPPVILVNGFDLNAAFTGNCELEPDSTGTFGRLQELLEADGRRVIFFDNCRFGAPAIETLGQELGRTIADLGEPVDIIGFSLGGLVVRAYLSGKQPDADAAFVPPADTLVHKAILVATPHFGSPLAQFAPSGFQGPQMRQGSRFTWELARWAQGQDDLRETDLIAVVGDGGRGRAGDGVVGLASGSLSSFGIDPERTRVIEACHNEPAFLLCDIAATMIHVDDETHPTGRIIRSFLSGGDEWRSIGVAIDQHPAMPTGLYFAVADNAGALRGDIARSDALSSDDSTQRLDSGPAAFHYENLAPGDYSIEAEGFDGAPATVRLEAGSTTTVLVKEGPQIARIVPSAGLVPTLNLAPDSLVSFYGTAFLPADESSAADGLPLPQRLGEVEILANGEPLGLLFGGENQVNAYLPPELSGLVQFTLRNNAGQHTLAALLVEAVPAVFTLSGAGSGPAAAIDAIAGSIITAESPAQVGGFVSIFVTGLGATEPVVTLGGVEQRVLYAGPAPGFLGLQQINVEIAAETPTGDAVALQIGRANATTLAISR
ncbi:MAG: hypothetical protein R2748_28295 [Bryobacterales bacterium]